MAGERRRGPAGDPSAGGATRAPQGPATTGLPTPIGLLRLFADDEALLGVWFPAHPPALVVDATPVHHHPVLDHAAAELSAWFAGRSRVFTVPTRAAGTPFQRAVWAELARIPFGERRTYAQVAAAVGRPSAVRAVGAANAANPLGIIVPCHRVVATGGALAGFAGGTATKAWLLDFEAGRLPLPW